MPPDYRWPEFVAPLRKSFIAQLGAHDVHGVHLRGIYFHPETGTIAPGILAAIARLHGNQAGLYLNVVRAGKIREGDEIRRIPITV